MFGANSQSVLRKGTSGRNLGLIGGSITSIAVLEAANWLLPNRTKSHQRVSLRPDMNHVLNMKSAAQPALAASIQLCRMDLTTDNPFGVISPPSAPPEPIPAWSPFRPETPVPKSLDMLFPRAYFDSVRAAPPSPTIMRRFNEKVARLRKRGLAPEWMPNQKFPPTGGCYRSSARVPALRRSEVRIPSAHQEVAANRSGFPAHGSPHDAA